jgi:hypothetical protein
MTDEEGRVDYKEIGDSIVIQVKVEGTILTDYLMNGCVDDYRCGWPRQSQG